MGATDSIGKDLDNINNLDKCGANQIKRSISFASYIYFCLIVAVCTAAVSMSQSNLNQVAEEQCRISARVAKLEERMILTRESFTRLDERMIGVQRELSEIKTILRAAVADNTKDVH